MAAGAACLSRVSLHATDQGCTALAVIRDPNERRKRQREANIFIRQDHKDISHLMSSEHCKSSVQRHVEGKGRWPRHVLTSAFE